MSYISISTNQPSEGQRQLTEREPANLRNDFKVPIEIKNGDTIELVSLKFNVNAIIIDENNNKIVWSVGEAPFATTHAALIAFGSYDSPTHLAAGIQDAFNACTLLPSYQQQSPVNAYNFTTIPGWTCEWDTTPPLINGKFVITIHQSESPDLLTNGSIANNIFTTTAGSTEFKRLIADGYAVNNTLTFASTLPAGGVLALVGRAPVLTTQTGDVQLDAQVWAQKKWSPNSSPASELAITMYALAIDDTGEAETENGMVGEDLDDPGLWYNDENQFGNNGGFSFETSRVTNSLVVESQLSVDIAGNTSSFVKDMGGIYNNGGRIRAEVHPIIGYKLSDFTTGAAATAHLIGQTLVIQLQRWDREGDESLVTRNVVVTAAAAGDNSWSLKLTTTVPFDATGDDGPEDVTVLWLAYMPDLIDPTYGPLATYHNGMFAMGYTEGGGAAAPPDANNPVNHNAFRDPINLKARNYWYYCSEAQHFVCAYREYIFGGNYAFDRYTRPIRTPFCFNGADLRDPPTITNTASPLELLATQHLGYPAAKVGINRRARFTPNFVSQNDNQYAGYKTFRDASVGNKNDEACEYSISINNGKAGEGEVLVDATTGARVPFVTVVNARPFTRMGGGGGGVEPDIESQKPPFGDEGWLASNRDQDNIRMTDVSLGLAAFDPTQSIFLELRVDKNNEIEYTIAQQAGTTIVTANPFPVELGAYTNFKTFTVSPDVTENDTGSRIMESDYPLIPLVQVGGGGYYGISVAGATGNVEEVCGAAYTIDTTGPYRQPHTGQTQINPRLSFTDPYPQTAIAQAITTDGSGKILTSRSIIASNGSEAVSSIVERTDPVSLNREDLLFYNIANPTPGVAAELPDIYRENAEAINLLRANTNSNTGLPTFKQTLPSAPSASLPVFESENKVEFNGIENGLSVNILSGNIRGYNGGTADINKAVAYLQPEQLTSGNVGSRTFFHESKTSRPVEFNVPQTTLQQSMTVQLRNNNNELVRGIEAPVEVILYKRSKDTQLEKITAVLNGMKSDRQDNKIQTGGSNNPLLGVIPM